MRFRLIVLIIVVHMVIGGQPAWAGYLNLSPLLLYEYGNEDFSITAAGPIFEFSSDRIAIRPVLHMDGQRTDILYPLGINTRNRGGFFPLYSSRILEDDMHRTLFPFFHGRYMNKVYGGVFPVFGTLYHRFGYDKSRFFLWPLYSKTIYNEIETYHILWPVFSYSQDRSFNMFPFYGYKKTLESRHDFLLWPIFHHMRGKKNMDAALPLFQRSYGDNFDNISILWPFFSFSRDFQAEHTVIDSPWPLIRVAKGGYEETRIFPLYHKKIIPGTSSMKTILWPVYRNQQNYDKNCELRRDKTTILILSNHSYTLSPQGQGTSDITLWPVWYQTTASTEFSWYFPWILPFNNTGYKNNWLPILTLAHASEHNGSSLIDILWHTVFYQKDKTSSYFSLSFLCSYETGPDHPQMGFLFDLIKLPPPYFKTKDNPDRNPY